METFGVFYRTFFVATHGFVWIGELVDDKSPDFLNKTNGGLYFFEHFYFFFFFLGLSFRWDTMDFAGIFLYFGHGVCKICSFSLWQIDCFPVVIGICGLVWTGTKNHFPTQLFAGMDSSARQHRKCGI